MACLVLLLLLYKPHSLYIPLKNKSYQSIRVDWLSVLRSVKSNKDNILTEQSPVVLRPLETQSFLMLVAGYLLIEHPQQLWKRERQVYLPFNLRKNLSQLQSSRILTLMKSIMSTRWRLKSQIKSGITRQLWEPLMRDLVLFSKDIEYVELFTTSEKSESRWFALLFKTSYGRQAFFTLTKNS